MEQYIITQVKGSEIYLKTIDFSKSVYELAKKDPEVIEIMKELGFTEITNSVSLQTVGRVMTIPKGSMAKGIPLQQIVDKFQDRGFQVINSTM